MLNIINGLKNGIGNIAIDFDILERSIEEMLADSFCFIFVLIIFIGIGICVIGNSERIG